MKMIRSLLHCLAISTVIFSVTSCSKLKDEIISNIDPFYYATSESFEIPAPLPPMVYTTPEQTETININQIIKGNAGLSWNSNNFSYISLKDITLHLNNNSESSNWFNFEYLEVQANTDKGLNSGKPWLVARTNIDTNDPAARFSDKILAFDNANIKGYVNGDTTTVRYRFIAKVVTPIVVPMQLNATIRYEFRP